MSLLFRRWLFKPCFPAFFNLLISLGQQGLVILHLRSGSNLGPHRVIPHSPIKLLEFSFQPIRKNYSDSGRCCIQKSVDEALPIYDIVLSCLKIIIKPYARGPSVSLSFLMTISCFPSLTLFSSGFIKKRNFKPQI